MSRELYIYQFGIRSGLIANMINLSTESSAVENSKESVYSKRSRGNVRLPPLSTGQLTRYIPQQEAIMQIGRERDPSYSSNLPSPFITEKLLTPTGDYKCPRSPSNLSLQFNFEEPRHAETAGPFEEKMDRVKAVSKNGQKRVKSSLSKTPRNGKNIKMRPKGYHVLNNEESIALVEKPTASRERQSSTIIGTSTVRPQANSREDKAAKPSVGTGLRVERANSDKERKRSTYDLREFLSLPSKAERKINSMSPCLNSKANLTQHDEKKPVKLSPKSKSSDDCTYDVFEFLSLSAESSRHLTGVGQNKLKEMRPQKAAKGKGAAKSTKKREIPSVIVADWNLNDDSPKTKQLIRHSRELPKANFPSYDFPRKSERHSTLETPKTSGQRNSVYNINEFLMLPDVARRHSIKKVNPQLQDAKPRSNSLETDSIREPDVKYDLGEFLNFLESGSGGLQVNTASRERSVGELQNRSLSVYDVYEFLKASNVKELSAGVEGANESQSKPSIIDVTTLVAKTSPSKNEENSSQASCYNLREFLTLPVTIESNQNESQNSMNSSERLKIN